MEKYEVEKKYGSINRTYSNNELESVKKCRITSENKDEFFVQARKKIMLTMSQAEEDINHFFNCIKLCYSGFDTFLSDEICNKLEKNLCQKLHKRLRKTISNELLCEYLYKELAPFIQESHFMLICGRLTRFFSKPYIAYVSEIVLKETEKGFLVIKGNKNYKENYIFNKKDVEEYLLPTLYPEGMKTKDDKFFLLGIYSLEKKDAIKIDGKKIKLHRILSDFAEQKNGPGFVDYEKYAVVNHPTYQLEKNQEVFEAFKTEGKSCSAKENVILNLLGNRGGTDFFPDNFFDGFIGTHYSELTVARLQNPLELDNPVVKYEVYSLQQDKTENDYKGQFYVLMNKSTASSGEDAVAVAKNIPGTIFAGSASCGCDTFGDCIPYQLPNSKMIFYFGYKYFAHNSFEEGKGYLPDYWIDSIFPLEVVENHIKRMMI